MKKEKSKNMVKTVAEKNMKSVLSNLVGEVFEPNPTREDYKDALSFIEDIVKNAKKEPNYLKLLAELARVIEKSRFAAKLLPFIFKTVVNQSGTTLEFDHELIMEELKDAAEELQQLEAKAKK